VPPSLLNRDGENPMFCLSSGVTGEFRDSTKIRGIGEKIDKGLGNTRGVGEFRPELRYS